MKLAITGGAGFLGLHLCRKLADKYEEVLVLDIAEIDSSEYPKKTRYLNVDIRDYEAVNKALKGVDVVVHGAAALPLWKNKDIYDVNLKGTENVLNAARENKIERVVFVSSTAVYGVPEKHPIYEDDPLVGVGAYGESKIQAEKICEKYRGKGMCVPIVRPKTFIGVERLGVFQILYDWVQSGKKIPVIGNGRNKYQLLEVEDLVDAIDLMLTAPADKANDTFNVGAKEFNAVTEDVGGLCKHAGSGARVMTTPAGIVKFFLVIFEAVKLSPLYKWVYGTADKDSYVSTEKIEKTLGWKPKYSNVQALIRSYQWYVENADKLSTTGITHRVAWKQGILSFIKKFM